MDLGLSDRNCCIKCKALGPRKPSRESERLMGSLMSQSQSIQNHDGVLEGTLLFTSGTEHNNDELYFVQCVCVCLCVYTFHKFHIVYLSLLISSSPHPLLSSFISPCLSTSCSLGKCQSTELPLQFPIFCDILIWNSALRFC